MYLPRATRAAAVLKERLGVDATLIKGAGGVFQVAVDGEVVARKTLDGFPTEDAIIDAVRARMIG
jgi:selenoprotein W-related protein